MALLPITLPFCPFLSKPAISSLPYLFPNLQHKVQRIPCFQEHHSFLLLSYSKNILSPCLFLPMFIKPCLFKHREIQEHTDKGRSPSAQDLHLSPCTHLIKQELRTKSKAASVMHSAATSVFASGY